MNAWYVLLNGKIINIVWFNKDCDKVYIKNSLINHHGYNHRIRVVKSKDGGNLYRCQKPKS
jgi:hypothetical protein